MSFTRERIDEIIDSLRGTCLSLQDFLEDDEDQDDKELTDAIDQDIFCCEGCNWWCERSEGHENKEGGEDICDDCHKEHHDDDDDEE